MDDPHDHQLFSRTPVLEDLVRLCKALNEAGVNYVVIGGFAVAHHGYPRGTGDIDLLVDPSPENVERIRTALSYLPDQAVLEVKPTDVQEYVVVRVADEVLIDLLQKACDVTFDEAKDDIEVFAIAGVNIPFAGLRSLIRTKRSLRLQDVLDKNFLEGKIERLRGKG